MQGKKENKSVRSHTIHSGMCYLILNDDSNQENIFFNYRRRGYVGEIAATCFDNCSSRNNIHNILLLCFKM